MVEYLSENNVVEYNKLFKKSLKKFQFEDIQSVNQDKCILLYKEGSTYVGFLGGVIKNDAIKNYNIGHIISLYVLPSYRNEGKAYLMIKEFEEWLKTKNCTDMVVGMPVKNKKSLDFFEKVSFQNIGTCVIMKKSINQNL